MILKSNVPKKVPLLKVFQSIVISKRYFTIHGINSPQIANWSYGRAVNFINCDLLQVANEKTDTKRGIFWCQNSKHAISFRLIQLQIETTSIHITLFGVYFMRFRSLVVVS